VSCLGEREREGGRKIYIGREIYRERERGGEWKRESSYGKYGGGRKIKMESGRKSMYGVQGRERDRMYGK
jgi:hypothetical protein